MSRRLVNHTGSRVGGSRVATQAPVESSTPGRTTTANVPYEPLAFPLNEAARSGLGNLSQAREITLAYQNQLKDALRSLGLSVYDVQHRLQTQRERLHQLRTRREERGSEKTPEETRLETHVEELERDAGELTRTSEAAVRKVIDLRAELEDDSAGLGEVYTRAAMSNQAARRRQQNPDDEDDETTAEVKSALHELHAERTTRKQNYNTTSPFQRYSVDNDYIAFKKLWHDGLAGDDGPPLPDASKWFRADGTPVMSTSVDNGANEGDDDSDQELAVAREVLSLNCPLTLRTMDQPYSNRKCKHTFEKSAILDYLRNTREAMQCPQTGCVEKFKIVDFDRDFYLDQVVLRRIQRAKHSNENYEMEVESEDEEGDASVAVRGHKRRPGRHPKEEDT